MVQREFTKHRAASEKCRILRFERGHVEILSLTTSLAVAKDYTPPRTLIKNHMFNIFLGFM